MLSKVVAGVKLSREIVQITHSLTSISWAARCCLRLRVTVVEGAVHWFGRASWIVKSAKKRSLYFVGLSKEPGIRHRISGVISVFTG